MKLFTQSPYQIFEPSFNLLQQQYKKGMLNQKENYLNIQYERGRGLRLNWNFKDIIGREKYFRHLIVIVDHEKEFINSFVQTFYKKMKYGDILSCLHLTNQNEVKLCNWIEKTQINKFKPKTYLRQVSNNILDQKNKKELMQRAAMETTQIHDFVVVNVLMNHNDTSNFYRQMVENGRLNGNEFNYIVNFFGRIEENKISIYKGINIFRISVETISEFITFYHNFINSAVLPFASIKIECLNGQIGLFNESKWRNGDFNTIQAMLYGPSPQFCSDLLLLYIQNLNRSMDIYLQITLNFKLFTLKKYENVKKMHLSYSYEKDGSMTVHEIKSHRIKLYKNIYVDEDPYSATTVVKIFQRMDSNNMSSFQLI